MARLLVSLSVLFAFAATAVPAASADEFLIEADPAGLTTEGTGHRLVLGEIELFRECETHTLTGTQAKESSPSVVLNLANNYICEFSSLGTAGCSFAISGETVEEKAPVSLECEPESALTFFNGGCELRIEDVAANHELIGATLTAAGKESEREVVVSMVLEGMHYTGKGCAFFGITDGTHEDGFYEGAFPVRAFEAETDEEGELKHGGQLGFWFE